MYSTRIAWKISFALVLALALHACGSDDDDGAAQQPEVMPLVFVHGQSGSAQQFESQAMRFTSNGYPQDMLFAFEYNTGLSENPLEDLDAFIDGVLAETGHDQIYAVGHSRGTSMWTEYLEDARFNGPDKVAKYVNIDGRSPDELPGGVPTIGIWGEWNTAGSGYNRNPDDENAQIGPFPEDNFHFADKSHTEVATSAEAFGLMYEFLTGVEARTTDVAAVADGGEVRIAGRALFFPQNEAYVGSAVEVWEVNPDDGHRIDTAPLASFEIGTSGDFGPVTLASGRHYEMALLRDPTDVVPVATVHHFYAEPFTHDDYFVRLLSSLPGESIAAFIPREADASGALVIRMREFWGDQGQMRDALFIDGLDVLTPEISPRTAGQGSGVNLAVFLFDDESDKMTDLDKGELSPFNGITFLTAADVYTPSSPDGSGTIEIRLITRGEGEKRIYTPSWPGDVNRNTVMFRDDTVE